MPLFNWDGGDRPIIKDGFKYYWTIAIPLTLFIILCWPALTLLLPWSRWLSTIRSSKKRTTSRLLIGKGRKMSRSHLIQDCCHNAMLFSTSADSS